MRSRAVRLTLTLLAVGALATAAYLFWNLNTRIGSDVTASRDINARIVAASRHALELRGAQQAYVAAGQSEEFWIAKATAATAALDEAITAFRVASLSPEGRASVDRAAEALEAFGRIDRRARAHASSGQKLMASDLIFSDGLETTGQIVTALDELAAAEAAASEAAQRSARNEQMMYAAGAGAVALLALVLLAPAPKPEEPAVLALEPQAPVSTATLDTFDLGALDAKETAAPVSPPPPAMPELGDVAEVCAQLARLSDTSSLPAILQRTALALDASGVVLWLADPSGVELSAVAAHGYAPSVLTRMGTITRESENVTAAAFRTGLLQIVKADTMSNGAIAAPLVNQAGCIGVMSAEVRHEGEAQPARLSIATIVASQLATLVAPVARTESAAKQA